MHPTRLFSGNGPTSAKPSTERDISLTILLCTSSSSLRSLVVSNNKFFSHGTAGALGLIPWKAMHNGWDYAYSSKRSKITCDIPFPLSKAGFAHGLNDKCALHGLISGFGRSLVNRGSGFEAWRKCGEDGCSESWLHESMMGDSFAAFLQERPLLFSCG